MKLINKSSNASLIRQAKNSTGGIINLTGSSITASIKDYPTAATNLFQKKNTAAGGSDSQIEVLNASLGYYSIKILVANTAALDTRTLYCGVSIIDTSLNTYTDAFYIKIIENKGTGVTHYATSGTTAQRPTLTTADVPFEYFDTDLNSPIWWNGTEWL